jgi:hypothetical protein
MAYTHEPQCPHLLHACGFIVPTGQDCKFCAAIVIAKGAGRDDMLAILSTDPNPTVALAGQNAAAMCVYTLPSALEEM